MNKKVVKRGLISYALLFIFLIAIMIAVGTMNQTVHEMTYGEFMDKVANKEVEEIVVTPRSRESVYNISGTLKDYDENESFSFNMPLTNETMVKLLDAEEESNFTLNTAVDPGSSVFLLFLINVLPY